jgi:hypothetical protein
MTGLPVGADDPVLEQAKLAQLLPRACADAWLCRYTASASVLRPAQAAAVQGMTQKKSPAAEPIAVDVRGAMRMLSLGRSSVLNLADSGELTKLRFGRSVRYWGRRRRGSGRAAAPVGKPGSSGPAGWLVPADARRSGGVAAQVAGPARVLTGNSGRVRACLAGPCRAMPCPGVPGLAMTAWPRRDCRTAA